MSEVSIEDKIKRLAGLRKSLEPVEYTTTLLRRYDRWKVYIVLIYGLPGATINAQFYMKDESAESYMDVEKRIKKAITLIHEIAKLK